MVWGSDKGQMVRCCVLGKGDCAKIWECLWSRGRMSACYERSGTQRTVILLK